MSEYQNVTCELIKISAIETNGIFIVSKLTQNFSQIIAGTLTEPQSTLNYLSLKWIHDRASCAYCVTSTNYSTYYSN